MLRLKSISTICLVLMVIYWIFIILLAPMRTYPVLADFEVFPLYMLTLGVSNLITTFVVFLLIRSIAGRMETQEKLLKRQEIPPPLE